MSWLIVPFAYLLGSISFAYLAGRLRGVDLRQHGSKNLGATNAGRVLGTGWFWVVFTLDLAKGLLPVLAARWLAEHHGGDRTWLPLATAAAVLLGHVFTCFHGFRGGKAVASALGVLLALLWEVALATGALWLAAWLIGWAWFRLGKSAAVGPASMLAALMMPVFRVSFTPRPWSLGELPLTLFCILVALLVLVLHRGNFQRLRQARSAQKTARSASAAARSAAP